MINLGMPAGCSVVVFDYRGFGASGGAPRQVLDIGRQHDDWLAAITYARTRTPAARPQTTGGPTWAT